MANETILIVEDNPVNMELARDLLTVAGYKVLEATTAEAGLDLAEDAKPALILMDVGLPGMDGLEATRRLKKNPDTSAIPVMALTSHAMTGDEDKAREAGCDDYMTKPLNTRTFAARVASAIENTRPAVT
jgi:CheY-like chemotaxis protein